MGIDKEKILEEIRFEILEEEYNKIKERIKKRVIEKTLKLEEIEAIEKEIDLLIEGKKVFEDGDTIDSRTFTNLF